MNSVDRYAPGKSMPKEAGVGPNSTSMATIIDATSSLIYQAEAMLGACRALLEQTRQQSTAGVRERGLDEMVAQAAQLADRAGAKVATAFVQSNPVLRGTPHSYDVDTDALELFRSRLPSLPRGAAIMLVTLLTNCGRIVSHADFRAVLKTDSLSSVKIHMSRIRSTLTQHGIEAKVLSVRGGYGMSTEAAEKLIDGLDLSPSERSKIMATVITKEGKDSSLNV